MVRREQPRHQLEGLDVDRLSEHDSLQVDRDGDLAGPVGRLIEAMTGGTSMVESMHGAGSPQAQRIMILREGKLDEKIKLAKALAGIPNTKKKKNQTD